MNEWMDIHAQMNGWIGGWISKQTLNRPWIAGSMVRWLGRWPDRLMAISPNTHAQTWRRLMDIAISPHVMSAPNSLHTLRNGRLPTLGRREEGGREGGREIILQILLLHYTNPYSCEWCQKKFVTKINLKKKKKTLQTQFIDNNK